MSRYCLLVFLRHFFARTMADSRRNVNLTGSQSIMVNLYGGLSKMRIIDDNIYMIMPDYHLVPLSPWQPLVSHGGGELTTPYDPSEAGGRSERTLDRTPRSSIGESPSASGSERTLDCTPRFSMRESPSAGEPQPNFIFEGEILHIGN